MTPPVFKPADWQPSADGVWEVQARPSTLDSRPPYEATCYLTRGDRSGRPSWTYELYQPASTQPDAQLHLVADGPAKNLGDGQRQADVAARRHRDHRPASDPASQDNGNWTAPP